MDRETNNSIRKNNFSSRNTEKK